MPASPPPPADAASSTRWRIVLVDDHPVVRMGLSMLIDAEPDLAVCGQAEDFDGALRVVAEQVPDLVLVDLSLRGSSGLDLLKELARDGRRALVVSMHESPTWAERALAAGARGYVLKSEAGRVMVQAIRKVRAGRVFVSESIADALLEHRVAGVADDPARRIAALTDRELEVLARIGEGRTTQQIGAELQLSPKTVQTYRERIKRKLALDSAAALSREATRWVLEERGARGEGGG
ncbi:MAG: response regulator [Pseudomonadota bacterium]|jgi:DNA-binding NarL/FixJ family response regulator